MNAIREIISREALKNYTIPQEFGDKFEMILLPIKNDDLLEVKREKNSWTEVSENEQFLGAVYNSIIEENKEEDMIWSKYL